MFSMRFKKQWTLEPQKYVVARTVWMKNILLVSGRLVNLINQAIFYLLYFQRWTMWTIYCIFKKHQNGRKNTH